MATKDTSAEGHNPGISSSTSQNGTGRGTMGLIEKPLGIGRSEAAQQIAVDALRDAKRVVYYISGSFIGYLTYQMRASGLDIVNFLRNGQLRVFPLDIVTSDALDPGLRLVELERHMRQMSLKADDIIVDSVTEALVAAVQPARDHFYSTCRDLCADGLSVLTVVQTDGCDEGLLQNLHESYDVHFSWD